MTPKDFFYHPTLCPIPWHGVYIEPDGRVLTCAVAQQQLGNIKEAPIQQILTQGHNRQIRIEQLDHKEPKNCNYCYKIDKLSDNLTGSPSNRSWYKKMFAGSATSGIYDSADNFRLEILDLRWRNTCNLACAYCSFNLSSRWAQELGIYPDQPSDKQINETKEWIYKHLPTVKHVYLAGGEPLLIKENLEMLNKIQEINPDVEIRVNTNLINIDTPVFKKLLEFPDIKWTVSVENTHDQFYYTRFPGDWATFEKNLSTLSSLSEDVNFNMTWSLMGAYDIFDCIEYFLDKGYHENMFIVNMLTEPKELDVRNLSQNTIDRIKNRISGMLSSCTNPNYWLHKSLSTMYNFIMEPIEIRRPRRALDFFHTLDQRRNLDFSKVFPDIYQDLMSQIIHDTNKRSNG